MPRNLTPTMVAALSAPIIIPALFASLTFGDHVVSVWTGVGAVVWNSVTFTGIGSFGTISAIDEGSTVEAKALTMELSGIPVDLVAEVLTEVRVLGTCNIWLGLFNQSGALYADPVLAFQGKMDAPTIKDGADTCTLSLSLESVLVDLNRAVYRRYTDADQQQDLAETCTRLGLPTNTVDTGFTHVPGIQERSLFWGVSPASVNNS